MCRLPVQLYHEVEEHRPCSQCSLRVIDTVTESAWWGRDTTQGESWGMGCRKEECLSLSSPAKQCSQEENIRVAPLAIVVWTLFKTKCITPVTEIRLLNDFSLSSVLSCDMLYCLILNGAMSTFQLFKLMFNSQTGALGIFTFGLKNPVTPELHIIIYICVHRHNLNVKLALIKIFPHTWLIIILQLKEINIIRASENHRTGIVQWVGEE